VPSRMIRAQDALSFDDAAERFRSEATDTFGSPRTGAELVATPAPTTAVHTLEQVSSVVKIRVTSPVRRCGPGHPLRARLVRW
jgi:hypothetical protein